jgi:hypothetical protein
VAWTWKIHFGMFSYLTSVSSLYQVSSAYWPCKVDDKPFWIHVCEHFVSEMKVVRSKSRSGCDCERLETACVATAHVPTGVVCLGGKETVGSLALVFFQSSNS